MKSIFEDLYCGNINPGETIHLTGLKAQKRKERYQASYKQLSETLNEQQQALLERVMDDYAEIEDLYNKAYYAEGWKSGIRLMHEALEKKEP